MKLRPYQEESVNAVFNEWGKGNKNTLLVLPTGTGKTIVFADIAKQIAEKGKKVLILAHRDELLKQAQNKIISSTGWKSALEKADSTSVGSGEMITVGSIQTLMNDKRLEKFSPEYFSNIIVDEAHHCLSDSYQKVLQYFSSANTLGVTATPDRGDMRNLSSFFDSLAYEYTLREAINDGYLSKIHVQTVPLKIDLSNVKVSMGDFTEKDLGNALDPYLEQIADAMTEYCMSRKTVVFLPLISTSQRFRDILNEKGFRAAEVNGTSNNREEILKDFEEGKYNVLCNSMLLTEGWDCPSVDCVVVLRPTKVRSLYCQMVGRGTRICEGKDNLLLLDFLWHTERHNICRPTALIRKDAESDVTKKIDELNEDGTEKDLFIVEDIAIRDAEEERNNALAKMIAENSKKKKKCFDLLEYECSLGLFGLTDYVPTFGWEATDPTQNQLDYITNLGINPDGIVSKGQASAVIENLMDRFNSGLCTPKQIKTLQRFGFQKVHMWTKDQASKMIGILAKNSWHMPYYINPQSYQPN